MISSTQVLIQTGRLKIARSLPHAALLARELVDFRFTVGREKGDDDLVPALATAAWEAERNPSVPFSSAYGVPVFEDLSRF